MQIHEIPLLKIFSIQTHCVRWKTVLWITIFMYRHFISTFTTKVTFFMPKACNTCFTLNFIIIKTSIRRTWITKDQLNTIMNMQLPSEFCVYLIPYEFIMWNCYFGKHLETNHFIWIECNLWWYLHVSTYNYCAFLPKLIKSFAFYWWIYILYCIKLVFNL